MEKFDWYQEKATLKATLNSCIRQGLTYEQTEQALRAQFSASCNVCIIATMGQCACDNYHKCFVEDALNRYLDVAREKCVQEDN